MQDTQDIPKNLQKIHPHALDTLPKDTVFLITCRYEKEIREQLKGLGFQHVFWLSDIYVDTVFDLRDASRYAEYVEGLTELFDALVDEKSHLLLKEVMQRRVTLLSDLDTYEDLYSTEQYFEKDIVCLSNDEVFIDCGAFDGDTVESFISHIEKKFKKIYAFEMDEVNYQRMVDRFQKYGEDIQKKIMIYNYGVSDQKEEFFYSSLGYVTRIEDNKGEKVATCVPLDDIIAQDEKVTLIAMDIEGAELKALMGAKNIIQNHKPRLAISSYHKTEHIYQVFQLLKKMNKDYRFYLRHHSKKGDDTVLYALN